VKSFVERPERPEEGNAQYWLGEDLYTRGRLCGGRRPRCRGLQALSDTLEGSRRIAEARHVRSARANQKQKTHASCWISSTMISPLPARPAG